MSQSITCPHCQQKISIDAALSKQMEADYQAKFASQKKAYATELTQKLTKELSDKLARENQKELDLLTEQLKTQKSKLAEAQEMELKLRKERTQLEEDQKAFELKVQRQLDEERKKIADEATIKATEEQHLKIAELQKQLQDADKTNKELARKLQQGSQQNQGEVLELELEDLLRTQFLTDEIKPVAKGVHGADIEQIVRDQFGQTAGTLLWELKQTKAFSEGWIAKLKEDQRQAKAEIAILVTTVLPKGIANFGLYNGIWVTDFASAKPLASALRINLLGLARERQSAIGKDEKMEQLYSYITGTQFRQRIEAIVEAFTNMQTDLQKEKNTYQRIWTKREKQIEQVLQNTIGLHGNLEGLVGSQNLPQLASLEFDTDEEESQEETGLFED